MKFSRENVMTSVRVGLVVTAMGGGFGGEIYFGDKAEVIESDAEAKAAFSIKNPPAPEASPQLVEFTAEIAALNRQESSIRSEAAATSFANNKDSEILSRTFAANTEARIKDIEGQIASIQESVEYQVANAPQNDYQHSLPKFDRLRADKKAELMEAAGYKKSKTDVVYSAAVAAAGFVSAIGEGFLWSRKRKSFPLPEKRSQSQTAGGRWW